MKAAILVAAALAAGCGGDPELEEVRVFAASSLTDVMQTIAADFEKETGTKVVLNLAASSTLARQIVEGAPCDVFLSADQEWADFVEKAGLVEPGTRVDLLSNDLVLVYSHTIGMELSDIEWPAPQHPDPRIEPDWHRQEWIRAILTRPQIHRIAIGDPNHVPAGRYAKRYFDGYDAWRSIEGKVVACESVRAALALVERGEAEVGIVYVTDAHEANDRGKVFKTGPTLFSRIKWSRWEEGGRISLRSGHHPPACPIRYPVLKVRGGSNQGDRFLEELRGEAAREVFGRARFEVLPRSE